MRIQILSDLHIKYEPFQLEKNERDLLILAGDIGEGKSARPFIESQLEISPIIYVLGNHEFQNNHLDKTIKYWKNLGLDGLYVLEMDSVTFDNITFLGCTLWSDILGGDPVTKALAKSNSNDYKLIWNGNHLLTPDETMKIHQESVSWLEQNLSQNLEKVVVITHFLPSLKSLHPNYQNSNIAGTYYSNLDWMIEKYQPDFWIHGHIHQSMDYDIGKTRVICNPRGYEHEEPNILFNPSKIIEI